MEVRPLEMLELKLKAFKITFQETKIPWPGVGESIAPPSAGGQTEL